ncbi:TonB-dependent receptor [bacterium]|nr:TonB-dependent receptor [bacterium]
MKQVKRAKSRVLVPLILIQLCWSAVYAGNTGKIAGDVMDATQNRVLPGANVVLEDTYIGAATDLNGHYTLLNVPPGVYSLKITMMGYRTMVVQNVRVSVDLTTKINADLDPTVLESRDVVTVTAERPLVQRDMTSSQASINSEEIKNLPVQNLNDVLELQAGVVRDGNDFHIRGGRAGEVSYWVDGIATNEVYGGGNAVTVEKSAVQEMQVVSGTFNAEYGNAMSGIVNMITKDGGSRYEGEISAYTGDYISGRRVYGVLREVKTSTDPETGATTVTEDLENPLKKYNPVYNIDANLSGPVPFLKDRVTFMVNGRYFSQEGYQYGRRWYYPQGIPGDSALVPLNPYTSLSGMGKLTVRLGNNIKMNYSVFMNQWNSDHYANHTYKYNPDGTIGGNGEGLTHIFGWNHVLSSNTFYEARVSHVYNHYEQYVYENPELYPSYFIEVLADSTGPAYIAEVDPLSDEGKALLEELKTDQRQYRYVVDPANREGYMHPDSLRDPAAYSFWRSGTQMDHFYRTTAYWIGKLDLTSQVTAAHQVKTGFELRLHELSMNSYTLQPKLKEGLDEQIVPFQPWVPPSSYIYHHKYTRKPREFSAYIQDKIELVDMIVNIGVRMDYFDPNSNVPVDPRDPNIYNPFKAEYRYKNYIPPPDSIKGPAVEEYNQQFSEYSAEERRAFMQKKADTNVQLSPRLGIAYPITDRGIIHFSYGHFFQIPEFQWIYSNPDFKLYTGGGTTIIGNANLKPQRTIQYEIGLQQQLTDQLGMDLTLFYKDIRDWVGTSPLVDTDKPSVAYSIYENKDYANVYGLTLNVEKRFADHYGAGLSYSFQVAEGTYSNPNDAYNAIQNENEPRLTLIPLNWDQRHTLMGNVTLGVRGWIVTFQGKYQTGRPYTPSFTRGAQVGGSNYIGYRDNSANLPTVKSLDILLHKRFRIDSFRFGLFVTLYNALDQSGETYVYTDTGTAEYTTNIDPKTIPYVPERVGTVEDLIRRPDWYIAPRQIQAGISLEL